MTDKITLELTLDELKLIDKYVELNEETKSVFDKIKDAYPQIKMTLQQEGDYAVVSYNDTTYYRFMNETTFAWYIKKGVSANYHTPTLVMVTDGETERLLDGLYYNDVVVKKEKEQQTKSPVEEAYKEWWGEYPSNTWQCDVTRWEAFQMGYNAAYEEKVSEWEPTPQTPEQVADGLGSEGVGYMTKHPLNDWEFHDDAEKSFSEWFHELVGFSFRSEWFDDDCEMKDVKTRRDLMYKWIHCAFAEGYRMGCYLSTNTDAGLENDKQRID